MRVSPPRIDARLPEPLFAPCLRPMSSWGLSYDGGLVPRDGRGVGRIGQNLLWPTLPTRENHRRAKQRIVSSPGAKAMDFPWIHDFTHGSSSPKDTP